MKKLEAIEVRKSSLSLGPESFLTSNF